MYARNLKSTYPPIYPYFGGTDIEIGTDISTDREEVGVDRGVTVNSPFFKFFTEYPPISIISPIYP